MSSELTLVTTALTLPADKKVTLLDVRMDSKTFPRIKAYKREDAETILKAIIFKAHTLKGIQADDANIAFMATELMDAILEDEFGLHICNLSFLEINHIIKKAVLTTEMYGISVANLYKAIVDWIKAEGIKLQDQANRKYAEQQRRMIAQSPIAPMLQVFAGAMTRNQSK